jgi:6-phosphogluconate dehydrogenase
MQTVKNMGYRQKLLMGLSPLILDSFFVDALKSAEAGWRRAVVLAVEQGIPAPAFASALAYFDGYRSERLPANLLQAQRDYFGAHTYERKRIESSLAFRLCSQPFTCIA